MSGSLRKNLIRLAHINPNLRPHLLPLLREAADGHRLLQNVDSSAYKSLMVAAEYPSLLGERWHNNLFVMHPSTLDDRSQWTDAKMKQFVGKVEKSRGTPIIRVRVYGEPIGGGRLETLIDWSPQEGFVSKRESDKIQKKILLQQKEEATEIAGRENYSALFRQALRDAKIPVGSTGQIEVSGDIWRTPIVTSPKPPKGAQIILGPSVYNTKSTSVQGSLAEIIAFIQTEMKNLSEIEQDQTWSVARTGYEVGGDEEEEFQGYVAEVEIFKSKEKAIAHARDIGGAHVVKGTQMWNEPLGQVEEHDKTAWTRFYR